MPQKTPFISVKLLSIQCMAGFGNCRPEEIGSALTFTHFHYESYENMFNVLTPQTPTAFLFTRVRETFICRFFNSLNGIMILT